MYIRGGCVRVIDHMTFAYALAIKTSHVQCMMATSTTCTSVCDLHVCGESNDEHLRVMVFSTGNVIDYTVPSFPVDANCFH